MMTAFPEVAAHLASMGYSEGEIRSGLDLAEELEAATSDEALSIALSRILLGEADTREGVRFGVEPGSVDWESYKRPPVNSAPPSRSSGSFNNDEF